MYSTPGGPLILLAFGEFCTTRFLHCVSSEVIISFQAKNVK
nr:MAG TPA: hypothetical protein [Caudoviricetes sp.]